MLFQKTNIFQKKYPSFIHMYIFGEGRVLNVISYNCFSPYCHTWSLKVPLLCYCSIGVIFFITVHFLIHSCFHFISVYTSVLANTSFDFTFSQSSLNVHVFNVFLKYKYLNIWFIVYNLKTELLCPLLLFILL